MLKSNTIYALSCIINLTGQRISKREIRTFNQSTPIRKKNMYVQTNSVPNMKYREKHAHVHVCSFTYLISSAVESWNLRSTLQEAAAAFSQMLGHPGVQSGNAAWQTSLGIW